MHEDVKLETNKTILGEYTQHVKAFGNFILGVSAEGAKPKVLAWRLKLLSVIGVVVAGEAPCASVRTL